MAHPSLKYLEVGVLPGAQSSHPQVSQDDLTARMGQERPVIGRHCETKTRLSTPVVQFTRQQLLRLVIVLSVAEVQEIQS